MNEDTDQSFHVFGRDITKIPCFRNSYLYGIGGGLGLGLTYFLFTSKVRHACHFGVASFGVITLSYWVQCRYKYSKANFEMAKLKKGLQEHIVHEGTAIDGPTDA